MQATPEASRPRVAEVIRIRPVNVEEVSRNEGVTSLSTACDERLRERCNGFDDNCDGQVDEGCDFESAAITVTLTWNTPADLDLVIQEPSGELLSAVHRESGLGGRLAQVGRGACEKGGAQRRLERAIWPLRNLRSGRFRIEVHYWGECGVAAGLTTASVAISAQQDTTPVVFNYALSPGEHKELLSFVID